MVASKLRRLLRERRAPLLKTWGGYTFDAVRQAVRHRQDWKDDRDSDGRERWYGPCPLPPGRAGCRISAGSEDLDDTQEVLIACSACRPDDPGHLGGRLVAEHLDALGVVRDGSRN